MLSTSETQKEHTESRGLALSSSSVTHPKSPPNSASSWGSNVAICKPIGRAVFIQTTITCKKKKSKQIIYVRLPTVLDEH